MTPQPRGAGPAAHHNTMVAYRPSAALEDQVCLAWCEDCDWSIDEQSYERAVEGALGHQRATEARP